MRDLVVLFIHFIATLARLLGPGGTRSIVAESLLLKHQLLIVNRSRHRSPNLSAWDRILAGWMTHRAEKSGVLKLLIWSAGQQQEEDSASIADLHEAAH